MKRTRYRGSPVAAVIIALAAAACAPRGGPAVELPVAGGNSPAMPPLAPAGAHVEPAALEAAAIEAQRRGADALLVARNGHLIFERYWHGSSYAAPIEPGGWQRVIDDLLAGALAEDRKPLPDGMTPERARIALAAGMPYEAYLAKRLWRPIGAFDAVLAPGLRAAQGDWIRIGELLANDGVYQGEEIVRPGWAGQVLARHSAQGEDAPLASVTDLHRLAGAGASSLWVAPSLRLVILRTGGNLASGGAAGDARIAQAVIVGVTDRPGRGAGADGAPDPATLVPSH
jgi:hypothetical protein